MLPADTPVFSPSLVEAAFGSSWLYRDPKGVCTSWMPETFGTPYLSSCAPGTWVAVNRPATALGSRDQRNRLGWGPVWSNPSLALRSTKGGHLPSANFSFPITTMRRLPSAPACHREDLLSDAPGMFVERLLCRVRAWGSPSCMPVLMTQVGPLP